MIPDPSRYIEIPFNEEWRDEMGGIANAIWWMQENLTENVFYNGQFFWPSGKMVVWSYSPGMPLMYMDDQTPSNIITVTSTTIRRSRSGAIHPKEDPFLETWHSHIDPNDASKVKWLESRVVRVVTRTNNHTPAYMLGGFRGQILASLRRIPQLQNSLASSIWGDIIFPDIPLVGVRTPASVIPHLLTLEGIFNRLWNSRGNASLTKWVASSLGEALLDLNDELGSALIEHDLVRNHPPVREKMNALREKGWMEEWTFLDSVFSTKKSDA